MVGRRLTHDIPVPLELPMERPAPEGSAEGAEPVRSVPAFNEDLHVRSLGLR